MEDIYKEATGKNESLICRAREVTLSPIQTTEAKSCKIGEKIKLTLISTIYIESCRHDFGWYIASDGGNALTGKCVINSLVKSNKYNITAPGYMSWEMDHIANDTCGDVFYPVNATEYETHTIVLNEVTLAKEIEVTCTDVNDDGFLDVSMCFTWRDANHDTVCDPMALYPAYVGHCDCERFNVVNVTTTTNNTCI
jgi:hypothetical protein